MPFRRAHEMVGALVRKLIAERRDFESLSLEEWRAASDLFEADVDRADHAGGVGAAQADPAIDGARRRRAPGWRKSGRGWTASPASANMAPPFAFHSLPAVSSGALIVQQRQLRLGDILDDYCPRERRVTNHAVVAMIGDAVKQIRCTTCDAEHDFKHAKVPRQRRKTETPAALYAQVLATGPKRVTHDAPPANAAGDQESIDSRRRAQPIAGSRA